MIKLWRKIEKMKEKRRLKKEIEWTKNAIETMKEQGYQKEEIREAKKELEEMKKIWKN